MKASPRYRIDGINYADGRQVCVVVGEGGINLYRTREYTEEDEDKTPPAFLALREAQQWVERQKDKA